MDDGFPTRAPLNSRAVGALKRDGYRVDKILFDSRPKYSVGAALFLPNAKRFDLPNPSVSVACGKRAIIGTMLPFRSSSL